MTDDIEGDIGQEAPADTSPSSEPASDPAEELSSEIRRSIDTQRERGPDGKFVKGESARGAAKGVATGGSDSKSATAGTEQTASVAGQGEAAKPGGAIRPPAGFSVATKQAWDELPEHVKADIAKREADIEEGTKRYTGLSRFAEEAERNGTTLQNAVSDYVAVQNELNKDLNRNQFPVEGIEYLCQRLNINPVAMLKAWLSKYVPAQGGQGQPQQAPQQQIDPNAIANHAVNAVRAEFQQRQIHDDITQFSANPANRFFANVRQDMSVLVQSGKASNLQEAYEAACWLNPEIRAILIEEMHGGANRAATRTAARAQNAAKAVTGAPSNSHAGEAPKRRDLSLDDEIREAIRVQRGNA